MKQINSVKIVHQLIYNDYNNSSLCSNESICKTIDDNQECLPAGAFEGNKSYLMATLNSNSVLSNELSFRYDSHL